MYKFQIGKYSSKALISAALLIGYDMLIEKKNLTNSSTLSDALSFTLSQLGSDITSDVIANMWGTNTIFDVGNMLFQPFLSGVLYMYLYNVFVRTSLNKNKENLRSNKTNFMYGALSQILIKYLNNPISSLLFGIEKY